MSYASNSDHRRTHNQAYEANQRESADNQQTKFVINLRDRGNVIRDSGMLGHIAFGKCPPAIRIAGGVFQPSKVSGWGTLTIVQLVNRLNHQQCTNLWRNIRDSSANSVPFGPGVVVVWKQSG
jgi:hypothetical protein